MATKDNHISTTEANEDISIMMSEIDIQAQADSGVESIALAAYDKDQLVYTPTTWKQGTDGGTAITATRLNNIESMLSKLVARSNEQDAQISETTAAWDSATSVDSTIISSTINALKIGSRIGILRITNESITVPNPAPSGTVEIGVLPDGFKPNSTFYAVGRFTDPNTSSYAPISISIGASGSISVRATGANVWKAGVNLSGIVGELIYLLASN